MEYWSVRIQTFIIVVELEEEVWCEEWTRGVKNRVTFIDLWGFCEVLANEAVCVGGEW